MDPAVVGVARWLPLVGFEGRYEVSDQGQIRNPRTGRLLVGFRGHRAGHHSVVLRELGGRQVTVWVHLAVLRTFVGFGAAGQECRHLNGNAGDNRLSNLAWGTAKENSADRILHGTQHRKLTPEQVLDIKSSTETGAALARRHGVHKATVYAILSGQTWGWLTCSQASA